MNLNPATVDLEGASQIHQVNFAITPDVGNASRVTVTINPDVLGANPGTVNVINEQIPNLHPYENRVQFAGRTGGADMDVAIDNVSVNYANPIAVSAPTKASNTGAAASMAALKPSPMPWKKRWMRKAIW